MRIFITILTILFLSGCSTSSYNYNSDNVAGFYKSNYDDLPSNEKARMLMDDLKTRGIPYATNVVTYKIKLVHVYNHNGEEIFPNIPEEKKLILFPVQETPRIIEENL